jgi:hypothetical protein
VKSKISKDSAGDDKTATELKSHTAVALSSIKKPSHGFSVDIHLRKDMATTKARRAPRRPSYVSVSSLSKQAETSLSPVVMLDGKEELLSCVLDFHGWLPD